MVLGIYHRGSWRDKSGFCSRGQYFCHIGIDLISLCGFWGVCVDNIHVSFSTPKLALTIDGITIGYIGDEGVKVLQQHGFSNVLVFQDE